MKDLADADFVVEAVVESIEIKKAVFRELDDIVHDDAILATNTSSLSVTEISTATQPPAAGWSACTSSTRRRCRTSSR